MNVREDGAGREANDQEEGESTLDTTNFVNETEHERLMAELEKEKEEEKEHGPDRRQANELMSFSASMQFIASTGRKNSY